MISSSVVAGRGVEGAAAAAAAETKKKKPAEYAPSQRAPRPYSRIIAFVDVNVHT